MNNSVEAGKVLLHLQHLKADIMFLQETHLRTADLLCIKSLDGSLVTFQIFSESSLRCYYFAGIVTSPLLSSVQAFQMWMLII